MFFFLLLFLIQKRFLPCIQFRVSRRVDTGNFCTHLIIKKIRRDNRRGNVYIYIKISAQAFIHYGLNNKERKNCQPHQLQIPMQICYLVRFLERSEDIIFNTLKDKKKCTEDIFHYEIG